MAGLRHILAALLLCLATAVPADHIPTPTGSGLLAAYQHDAAIKRYADILKIAGLLDDYKEITGQYPDLSNAGDAIYDVAVLGQPRAVANIFANGTPFGFSLRKYRPDMLHQLLEGGLGQAVTLPIDPQRVGTNFAPAYFVFLRRATARAPAHYIVLGTFGQPVARSTEVARGVHLVAISNISVEFLVPVQRRDSYDPDFVDHAIDAGRAVDARFARFVSVALGESG